MNLFIESPQRAAERLARVQQGTGVAHAAGAPQVSQGRWLELEEPAPQVPEVPYSQAQDTYQRERAHDRRRARRRKRAAALRIAAVAVLLPLGLVAVFLLAYATTCILNGASPEELGELMGILLARFTSFVQAL